MNRSLATTLALAIAFPALLGAGPSTSPLPSPQKDNWSNPFCQAIAVVEPIDASTRTSSTSPSSIVYLVSADVDATKVASASVILVSDTAAYRVDIPNGPIKHHRIDGGAYVEAQATFKDPIVVRYAFVDTTQIDGAPLVTCPSDVRTVEPSKSMASGAARTLDADDPVVAPAFVQAVPPAGCAKIYEKAKVAFSHVRSGNYHANGQVVEGNVYVNSEGHIVKSEISKSSGIPGLDAVAIGDMQIAQYTPARFLCVPVVGEYRFRTEFGP